MSARLSITRVVVFAAVALVAMLAQLPGTTGAAPSAPGHAAIILATSSHDIVLCCISNQTKP
jgi:hypothetical protein